MQQLNLVQQCDAVVLITTAMTAGMSLVWASLSLALKLVRLMQQPTTSNPISDRYKVNISTTAFL